MYPTMFRIPFLPDWLADIKSYGVMMMIAFLTGIWLACRRAYKSQANPDIVLNMGFIALIFGVIGARAMFVLHYWDTRFASQSNPLMSVFDIRAGGLEFWGGPLLVIPAIAIYLRYVAKASTRWYLDITMPSLAWGLAITRIGCFLNGCCWGAICVDQTDPARERATIPWAVRFPYGSLPMVQQYKYGQLTLPKELIYILSTGESLPLPREYIDALVEDGGKTYRGLKERRASVKEEYQRRRTAGADEAVLEDLKAKAKAADGAIQSYWQTSRGVVHNRCQTYGLTSQQLAQLAAQYPSKPVHPAQIYATINGLILCWVLTAMFYYRKRHGIIVGWFLILYSISRVFLELIRQDNPLDVGGLTISQAISVATFIGGVLWLWVMYARMPLVSPRAVPYELPEEEEKPTGARKKK
ncbi:MAG: prolipoprotein diacylglyceryl transferase [Phycisphaerae bacterium]|nr:prolipoprotein diacylglyceryl transferase [Phycisphaerae bacterium]